MNKELYKYSELTSKIIGCAMMVNKTLGNGFQEVIYQRALEIEMGLAGFHLPVNMKCPYFIGRSKLEHEE